MVKAVNFYRDNALGSICLSMCLSALSLLNRLTFDLDFCMEVDLDLE